jgi:hypothetical protein
MGTVPRPPHHGAQSCNLIDNALKEKFHVQQKAETACRSQALEKDHRRASRPLRVRLRAGAHRALARRGDTGLGRDPVRFGLLPGQPQEVEAYANE